MINVTMQLMPHGLREGPVLCSIEIVNDGTGTAKVGNYRWSIAGRDGSVFKQGRLENWRRQDKSPGQLLAAILAAAYPQKNVGAQLEIATDHPPW